MTLTQMYICLNVHLPEVTFPGKLFSKIFTSQSSHLAEIKFSWKPIFQNLLLPDFTLGRNNIFWKLNFQSSHLSEFLHLVEITLPRKLIFKNYTYKKILFSRINIMQNLLAHLNLLLTLKLLVE